MATIIEHGGGNSSNATVTNAPRQAPPPRPAAEAAITEILVRVIRERSLLWFVLLSATALAGYAVAAVPSWWKLVGVAGYAILIVLPVLRATTATGGGRV